MSAPGHPIFTTVHSRTGDAREPADARVCLLAPPVCTGDLRDQVLQRTGLAGAAIVQNTTRPMYCTTAALSVETAVGASPEFLGRWECQRRGSVDVAGTVGALAA